MNVHKQLKSADLEEAQNVGRLRGVAADYRSLADACSKGGTFAESAVLDGGGEERGRVDLLPEIKAVKCALAYGFPSQ